MNPNEILKVYVSDIARAVDFVYADSSFKDYSNVSSQIEIMNFYISTDDMKNQNSYEKNIPYNTNYDGTVNMNTVLKATAICTKGHYLQVDKLLEPRLSSIQDHHKNVINPVPGEDDIVLGVERYSGIVVETRKRIQVSFMVEKSDMNTSLF